MPTCSCTGAGSANSPRGIHRGQRAGHGSTAGVQDAGKAWLLPIIWPASSSRTKTRRWKGIQDFSGPGSPSALRAPGDPGPLQSGDRRVPKHIQERRFLLAGANPVQWLPLRLRTSLCGSRRQRCRLKHSGALVGEREGESLFGRPRRPGGGLEETPAFIGG